MRTNTHSKRRVITESARCHPDLIKSHLDRLDDDYINHFSMELILGHLKILPQLSLSSPLKLEWHIDDLKTPAFNLSVVALECQGLLAVIAGVLSCHNLIIHSASLFSYGDAMTDIQDAEVLRKFPYIKERKVIGCFQLTCETVTRNEEFFSVIESEMEVLHLKLQRKQFDVVRFSLHHKIGKLLASIGGNKRPRLYPLHIDVRQENEFMVFDIQGQDTPVFLFALSNALFIRGVDIKKVFVHTRENKVHDTLYLLLSGQGSSSDILKIRKLKVAVALIKHFTLFLPYASDFDASLRHFDLFLDRLFDDDQWEEDGLTLEDDEVLSAMARLFGAGPYLWEEFVKMQYQSVAPWFRKKQILMPGKNKLQWMQELNLLTMDIHGHFDAYIASINRYKDRELFRIDLGHLMYSEKTFMELSHEMTDLAEAVLTCIGQLIRSHLEGIHGVPMKEGGGVCQFALAGLGKFGGKEMGYASDIELVLIYESGGETDGHHKVSNTEYFEQFIRLLVDSVWAKHSGVFELDLRLRPHGNKGPLAISLNRWYEYYSACGQALDYERQSLIKLRPFYGSQVFQNQILLFRRQLLFGEYKIPLENTLWLRKKQLEELTARGKWNAKYSQGGLCELEYGVQFLQLKSGDRHEHLQVQNTIEAMEALLEYEILSPEVFMVIMQSYAFLRRLINALRIYRGNAKDLSIPEQGSFEMELLSRQMGYLGKTKSQASAFLGDDLQHYKNMVQHFFSSVQESMDAISLSDFRVFSLPDFNVGPDVSELEKIVMNFGVSNYLGAFKALKEIYDACTDAKTLLSLFALSARFIRVSPDTDKSFFRLCEFFKRMDTHDVNLKHILFRPRYLELLVHLFSHSEYLSDFLLSDPGLIREIADEGALFQNKIKGELKAELCGKMADVADPDEALQRMCHFRNVECIRIGIQDFLLGMEFDHVTHMISDLYESILTVSLEWFSSFKAQTGVSDLVAVVAMGKFGGYEINYSSDIDLVMVMRLESDLERKSQLETFIGQWLNWMSLRGRFGLLFRIDMTLRPFGTQSLLLPTLDSVTDYYRNLARPWELQAYLKARWVFGHKDTAELMIEQILSRIFSDSTQEKVLKNLSELRSQVRQQTEKSGRFNLDLKNGRGSIRVIEFVIQGLQVMHGLKYPEIIQVNTGKAIDALVNRRLLNEDAGAYLKQAYQFLRKAEHMLQYDGWQQKHGMPMDSAEVLKIAKCLGYRDRVDRDAGQLLMDEWVHHKQLLDELDMCLFNSDWQSLATELGKGADHWQF